MKKILILEDDFDIANVLRSVLAEEGFATVSSAAMLSADDVYAINPDLVILDHWLLDGHGSKLCGQLKTNTRTMHIPVMLMSASYHVDQLADQCRADNYLEKPFDLDEMVGMVHMMIDRAQRQPGNE